MTTTGSAALAANFTWLADHPELLDGAYTVTVTSSEISAQGNSDNMQQAVEALIQVAKSQDNGEEVTTHLPTPEHELRALWVDGIHGRVKVTLILLAKCRRVTR